MTDQPVSGTRLVGRRTTAADDPNRPGLDIRVVLFTLAEGELLVSMDNRGDELGTLPRGLPDVAEPLDTSARRIVRSATGLTEHYLEQLYTLSVHEPPDDSWTVIVSYMALISSGRGPLPAGASQWHQVQHVPSDSSTDLMVIDYALFRLRAKLGYTSIAFHLLPETFTLTELQGAYESILSQELDKRNFRRRMTASGMLTATDGVRRDGNHRPAALYRFRPETDRETYLTPPWADGS